MLHTNEEFPGYIKTAGKITILTAVVGIFVFITAFVIDFGNQELSKVSAQSGVATTTLTVLNTPPTFTLGAYEVIESSTSTPTNSGDVIQWSAIGSDSNSAPYFLLVCSNGATPTAAAASGPGNLGTAPPSCHSSAIQWGVSTGTVSDTLATVSTTTAEGGQFSTTTANLWFAWVCDDDPFNPRCSTASSTGVNATNSSPFNVNSRPVLTNFSNDGPVDPGGTLVFSSVSSDVDALGGQDQLYLVVCNTIGWATSTNTCFDSNDFIASTTLAEFDDANATYTAPSIIRDNTYPAYGYIVDEHGHEAIANPIQQNFDVNNVAPRVVGGGIVLNGGGNMSLTIPGGETTGFTLDFSITDANSCLNAASSSEITDYVVSIFRSDYGTSTILNPLACDGSASSYNPNYCYANGAGVATWNLSCTATTTCASPSQDQMDYTCTFPLWFVADPTDNGVKVPAAYSAANWSAGVSGVDDDFATGTMATTSMAVEVISFNALDILANEIAYGSIEPGSDSGTLSATSTLQNIGNTGIDQEVEGESMCGTFTPSTECPVSATSTIPEFEQEFASTSIAYGSPMSISLSSSSPQEVELDVPKTTSTTTPNEDTTYWGIAVPISITLAGSYSGLNTFTARTAEPADW